VPKEFLPNHANLRITTKVNGVLKQDGNSKDLIYDEAHIVRYLSGVMTLYPGDVIATGTPDGVGAAREPREFLKPGDVVEIEIEDIGKLVTPMKAAPAPPTTGE
jgi:2-keto-4-pentenoate hydratase/2-oxohepta-3-ene-1,7-dioic acid hydratase in catechol pathway